MISQVLNSDFEVKRLVQISIIQSGFRGLRVYYNTQQDITNATQTHNIESVIKYIYNKALNLTSCFII